MWKAFIRQSRNSDKPIHQCQTSLTKLGTPSRELLTPSMRSSILWVAPKDTSHPPVTNSWNRSLHCRGWQLVLSPSLVDSSVRMCFRHEAPTLLHLFMSAAACQEARKLTARGWAESRSSGAQIFVWVDGVRVVTMMEWQDFEKAYAAQNFKWGTKPMR